MKTETETVTDDQLQLRSLQLASEVARSEYAALSARYAKLIGLMKYAGRVSGGRDGNKIFLSCAVSSDLYEQKGKEAAIFDLLNTLGEPMPTGTGHRYGK